MFRTIAAWNKGLLLDMVEDLYEKYSEAEISKMVDAYVVATDGIYGDGEDAVRLYLEEILADQYSGMNRGDKNAARAREAVAGTAQRFAGDIENARQNRAGIDRTNGPGTRLSAEEKQDQRHILTKLRGAISDISDMRTVASVSENAFAADPNKQLSEQVEDYFATLGNKVTRNGFGEVLLKYRKGKLKAGVASDIAHGVGRAKAATFEAVPQVIEEGRQIDFQENLKGKGYDSYAFAAPVTIGDQKAYMTVVVLHDKTVNAFYLHEVLDENGNFVIISQTKEDDASPLHSRPAEAGGDESSSNQSIAQAPENSKGLGEKNSQATNNEIDWVGNREAEQRLSAADEEDVGSIDLSQYTGKDYAYMEAVKNGDEDQIRWMNDEAARQAGFSHKGFHQTGADFTSFNTDNEVAGQFDDETPTGIFIKPTDEDIGLTSGTKQMPLYFKADNMLEFANREEIRDYWKKNVPGYPELDAKLQARNADLEHQYNDLDAEWFRVYEETYNSEDQSALDELDRQQDEFLERWNTELQPIRRQMKNLVTEYMKGTDFDGIHLKYDGKVYGGPKVETYIVFDPDQAKSAELVTRDDQGKIIPLSERFRTDRTGTDAWKNKDTRFSAAEDEEDDGLTFTGNLRRTYEEDGGQVARAAETGETSGRQGAVPTDADEGGRQGAVPTEAEDFEMLAREKKLALAEKVGIDGLRSRIKTAEDRLRMWKAMEKTGLMARDEKSVQELKSRIADAQETLDMLAKKQAARKAEQADKAAKAERQKKRAEEKKALRKEAELADNKPRQARKEFREEALNLFSVPAAKRQALGNILNSFADKMLAKGSVDTEDRAELFRQLYEAGVELFSVRFAEYISAFWKS